MREREDENKIEKQLERFDGAVTRNRNLGKLNRCVDGFSQSLLAPGLRKRVRKYSPGGL